MDDESRLVRGLAKGDRSAWATVYDRHVGDVFGLAFHLLGGDPEAAEEVNQEVWLLAIERIDRFDPTLGRFRDWLLGIARHRASRRYRNPGGPGRIADGPGRDSPDTALPPPDRLEGLERAGVVRAALLCLPEDRRRVLLQKYAEGLAVAEIAARSGKSPKAVESLLSRARDQLRGLLTFYFNPSEGGDRHEPTRVRPV